MEKRRFKNSGEYISLLGFGGLRLPLQKNSQYEINEEIGYEMIDYAINHGINYFDTAYDYHRGKSELFLGKVLSTYPRDKYNLATKMPLVSIKSKLDVQQIFYNQLEKCRVSYFDFYLLHNINKTDWDIIEKYKVYEFLRNKQNQGFIRHLGFSFHDTPKLLRNIVDIYSWDFAQIQLNYLDWRLQNAEEQYAILKDKNIPIIVMEPVRGGVLASLCKNSAEVLINKNPEMSVASWAIRYAASFPEVLTVLSGMSNMEQLRDNIKTIENFIPLQKDDYKILENVLAIYQKNATVPCTACGYCNNCPRGIDIPSVLAIYNIYTINNYAKNDFLFRYNILRKDKQAHKCIDCKKCTNNCPQHIDIPLWMITINKLYKKLTRKQRFLAQLKKISLLVIIYKKIKGLFGNIIIHLA